MKGLFAAVRVFPSATSVLQIMLSSLIGSLGFVSTASAQNDFFNTIELDTRSNASESSREYSVIAWITQKISLGLEAPGPQFSRHERELNRIETSLFSQLDGGIGEKFNFRVSGKIYHDEIYRFNGGSDYSADETNEFRNRFEIKDFYLEREYENGFYLKIGNQILAWGLSEYLRVTDLINPEDQYTFGQQDLQDLRLQVPAALLSYTLAGWTFDAAFTYHAGRNQMSPIGDEFDQLIDQRNSGAFLRRNDPENEFEAFFRASSHLSQGDLQIVAGEFNDNRISVDQIAILQSLNPQITYTQNRMRAIGIAANWVEDSWLFFGELGLHFNKSVMPAHDSFLTRLDGWDQKDQLLSVLGVEYNGYRNLLLSLEIDNIYTQRHDSFMAAAENQLSFASRLVWTALNDRLQLLAVWNQLADEDGRASRVSIDYNWSDSLEFGMMWVDYSSERESVFYEFRNNDVLQLHLRYNFQI